MKMKNNLKNLDIDKEGIFSADRRKGYPKTKSDKNTLHSYLETYEILMSPLKKRVKNVIEIGIWEGGSLKLWNDYFLNADIFGLDVEPKDKRYVLGDHNRIHPIFEIDAYDLRVWFENPLLNERQFDIIIDDGPHSSSSQFWSARTLPRFLNHREGILIIEDVKSMDVAEQLKCNFPTNKQKDVHVLDLRNERDRYDNILVVYDKNFNDKYRLAGR